MEDGSPRNAPLLVTAELPPDIYGWAEGLRRQHYPPERNRVRAHVTLFHALPPSVEDEVRRLLAHHAKAPPPKARLTGIMKLDRGAAFDIASDELQAIFLEMAERLHGVLTAQDRSPRRFHVRTRSSRASPARSSSSSPRRSARAISPLPDSRCTAGSAACGRMPGAGLFAASAVDPNGHHA